MERIEVTALLSPTRRLQRERDAAASAVQLAASHVRHQILVDAVEEDAFLKLLEEKLQMHMDRLADIDLVLCAKQINYIAYRLHEALEPKRDPETGVIQAWTIQSQSHMKVKMSSHIQVLKLSTILREVTSLRVHQQSQLRSPLEVEIFPALLSIELVHTDASMLQNVHFFSRQLRHLRLEHTPLESLEQVLSPAATTTQRLVSWSRLESLRINCCTLRSIDACVNAMEAIRVLDLGWNDIASFEVPARFTTVESLQLCHNRLAQFPPISSLRELTKLDLSMNQINSLRGIETLTNLHEIDVSQNLLSQITEIELLSTMRQLLRLNVRENPMARRPDHRREILFYLGSGVEVDNTPWTQTELSSMKSARRLETLVLSANSVWTHATAHNLAQGDDRERIPQLVMRYPRLLRASSINPQVADILAPPRQYSPRRRRFQQTNSIRSGRLQSSSFLKLTSMSVTEHPGTRGSLAGTATDVTEDIEDEEGANDGPQIVTVDDFFRSQRPQLNENVSPTSPERGKDGVLEDESDSDGSSSEKGRNRSRKYTESDFMRDFEEEESRMKEGTVDSVDVRVGRSSSVPKRIRKSSGIEAVPSVRVLLSAEDAAVFDLTFGIDGISASVDVKTHEILETLHVVDRETPIAFCRRLPDLVAIDTSTHSQRAKIISLKLRKQDIQPFGNVTYQIDAVSAFARILGPLIAHMYAVPPRYMPTVCSCSNCGGISHLTQEYVGSASLRPRTTVDALSLHSCLLCSSFNLREVSCDRIMSMYASEGIALAKRVKLTIERDLQYDDGFYIEETEFDDAEMNECVFLSACGIREAVSLPLATISVDDLWNSKGQ